MRAWVLHGKRDMRLEQQDDAGVGADQVLVKITVAGICGSDLHYFQHGANGTIVLKEPLVLGHEVAGVVEAVGAGVMDLERGQKVAINPSRPCGRCDKCLEGQAVHCKSGTFMGSAMRFPHTQGGFRELVTVEREQVFPVDDHVDLADAVFAEPLAVCIHALSHVGSLFGKRVLVTGAGPIGLLIVMLARHAGASQITSTDVSAQALEYAKKAGADVTVDVSAKNVMQADGQMQRGYDVAFECSGHPGGIATAIESLDTKGILVQVGMLGSAISAPLGMIVVKEIDFRGTFRFDREFGTAVDLICSGALDLQSLLSHRLPFDAAPAAMDLAADRGQAMKVQIVFPHEGAAGHAD